MYTDQLTIFANIPRLDNSLRWSDKNMHKTASLVVICLLLAISTASQTSNQHFNLGMTIDEFAKRFDLTPLDKSDSLLGGAAVRSAMRGERASIQVLAGGTKKTFLFDEGTLREVEITTANTFEHELRALTEPLGDPTVSKSHLAIWDRRDGTRFTLTSYQGSAVLRVWPTPMDSK
jgi:hypothetical protein